MSRRAHLPTCRDWLAPALLAVAALLTALLIAPDAESSLAAKVSNTANTVASGIFPNTCARAVGAAGSAAYLAYPLNEASGTTVADISGNNRPGTYTAAGVTYGSAGPCPRDGAKAVTLNGSTGYVSGAATPTNPQIFSVEIWFKTTTGGGKLIGLGNQQTGTSGQYDRQLWLSNTGILTFGVYVGGIKTVASTATYLDGKWHDAVGTVAPSTDANPGLRLYVDGALLASDVTTTSAENSSGYWRIGFDNLNGWGTNQPTNFYFTGSLAYASTYTYALTPTAVTSHYNAGI